MQAGSCQRPPGLHLAGDILIIERALGLQGDERSSGLALVTVLDRGLQRTQIVGFHVCLQHRATKETRRWRPRQPFWCRRIGRRQPEERRPEEYWLCLPRTGL